MTIDEAIKEMELHQPNIEMGFYHEYAKAHQLGIEALKWIKGQRDMYSAPNYIKLPSEVK